MTYSWIVPIYNEAKSLPQLLAEIKTAMRGKPYEIITVNDGSTDDSGKFATINLPTRQGKWAALRAGLAKAKGSIIITCDADLQDDPKEIKKLLPKILNYDLVSGWRQNRQDPFYKVFLSKLGNYFLGFKDINSPFKVYKRSIFKKLPQKGQDFRFSPLLAKKLGYTVLEVPISHRPRRYGKSKFGLLKYPKIIYDLFQALAWNHDSHL